MLRSEQDSENKYIRMSEAARACPVTTAPGTVARWCTRGVRARNGTLVRLSHVRIGRRLATTRASLDAFFKALADNDVPQVAQRPPLSMAHYEAERRCQELGF